MSGTTAEARDPGASLPTVDLSNAQLLKRMLGLGWQYRRGCLGLLALQGLLLVTGLSGLGLTGVGIDAVLYHAKASPHPAAWPLGWRPPADWPPMAEVGLAAGLILLFALVRGWLNYIYAVASGRLVHEQIVVDLRARVYDKLQRLSFHFFDSNTTVSYTHLTLPTILLV